MEAHPPLAVHDLFAAASKKFDRTRDWLCASEQSNARHELVEAHLFTAVRELGRLLMQAHMDLRVEREKPLPAPAAVSELARPRLLARNLDTVLGTVRVGRIAWQTPREGVRLLCVEPSRRPHPDPLLRRSQERVPVRTGRVACERTQVRASGRRVVVPAVR